MAAKTRRPGPTPGKGPEDPAPALARAVNPPAAELVEQAAAAATQAAQPPQEQQRPPFYLQAVQQANALGERLILDTPELGAVVVVFVWNIEGNLPDGTLVTREQPIPLHTWETVYAATTKFVKNLVGYFIQSLRARKATNDDGQEQQHSKRKGR
jgi:hypothetical protein